MNKTSQNGNAIIMILIAVSLFAALGYAFSNTSRTSTSFITEEESKAQASQIIAYGNGVKSAVKRLQLRGCSDTEINFENNIVAGYTNPNAPTDKSCDVFDGAGGGLNYKPIPSNVADINEWYFIAKNEISDIGSTCGTATCSDLIGVIAEINLNICLAINNHLNINNPSGAPPTDTNIESGSAHRFQGVYAYISTVGDEAGGENITGKKMACFQETTDSKYYFYHTLIAR